MKRAPQKGLACLFVILVLSDFHPVDAFSSLSSLCRHQRICSQQQQQSQSPLLILSTRQCRRRQASSSILSASSVAAVPANNSSDDETLKEKKRFLTREFLKIGGPALVQLAAEPLAALVDTAYLGRLGPDVLGGAGVAVSAQYAVSKLYNDPLLRTSISLVAAQDGKTRTLEQEETRTQELGVAVSSALLLAGTVGLIQWVLFSVFCTSITASMGVSPQSGMWHSAVSYLRIRAWGTPAATLWLVTNGIFRGLGDTRTPLVYSLVFTALNIVLDPLFIFGFGWGASGAAAGTALAQYATLLPLLAALNRKVPIHIWGQWRLLSQSVKAYLSAGSMVLIRTVGKVLAYGVCARQAALLGSVQAAAYNLTFQLGFCTTQICEAVAVAVQTLLARELATTATPTATSSTGKRDEANDHDQDGMAESVVDKTATTRALVRHLVQTAVWTGGSVATLISLTTWFRRDWIVAGLTTHPALQQAALQIFPVVLVTQVLKGLAYPVNGVLMGGLDWTYSMFVMWVANLTCVGLIRAFRVSNGGSGLVTLSQIWWALAAFMGTQVAAGVLRYRSKTGVWKVLKE